MCCACPAVPQGGCSLQNWELKFNRDSASQLGVRGVSVGIELAVLPSVFQVFRMNLEKLSKPELLTLFSILEGELEARDLVIEALKVCCKYPDKGQMSTVLLVRDPILVPTVLDNKCCISAFMLCVSGFVVTCCTRHCSLTAVLCVCFHQF